MNPESSMAPLLRRTQTHVVNRRNKSLQLRILKSACIAVLCITAMLIIIKLGSSSSSTPNNDPGNKPGVLRLSQQDETNKDESWKITLIEGQPSEYIELTVDDMIAESDGQPVDEIILKYVKFNPKTLITEALSTDIYHNVKKIRMERVRIIPEEGLSWKEFPRVKLPMLSNFQFDIDFGFHDQYTDYMAKIKEDGLIGLLFYDKDSFSGMQNVTDLGQKLVNDGVQVSLRVDGWSMLSFNRSDSNTENWEVILGLEFANKLLLTLVKNDVKITHLTMTECIVSMNSFPTSLQYLNLYRVNITDGDIISYFKLLQQQQTMSLTELYIELRNGSIKLSDIPKSVKRLSIGDIVDAGYDAAHPNLNSVAAETTGLGFPLDIKIVEHFDTIFSNVKNVGIFEPTNGVQHLLLQNILKTKATWILFEGFERKPGNLSKTAVEKDMEHLLENCGVGDGIRNFVLFKDMRTLSWYEMDLDKANKLKFRYNILGWSEYISWDVFSANFI